MTTDPHTPAPAAPSESLPEGWLNEQIGNLCDLKNGRAFKPSEWEDSGLPIVRIQNLNNPKSKYNYFQGEYDPRNYLKGGELLFAWSGTPGTSFGAHVWSGGEALLNQHIFRVDFDEGSLDKRFFRHAINQQLNNLIDIAHGGVGLRHVTKGVFESTEIPLPPLPEQIRIADKLDALLSRVEAGRERLERVPGLLKRFRQSVLSAAVSGELTREWRGGEDAEWERVTVGDLLASKPRNGYSPQAVDFETPVKSLTLAATTKGRFNPTKFKFIDEVIPPESHLWLRAGDILIQRANSLEHVGISAIFHGEDDTFIYPDLMMKAQTAAGMRTEFAHYVLLSEEVRAYFRDNATGTAGNMPKINQQTVITAPAVRPPLPEQTEIVRRVEALFTIADRIEARYGLALTTFDRLTPALLAKAFRGELVPQDPNDEPASVLLDRIWAARATASEKPRRGPKDAAKAAAGVESAPADGTQPKRRGRPPRAQAEASGVAQASSYEDAARRLEAQKLERAQGSRMVPLLGDTSE